MDKELRRSKFLLEHPNHKYLPQKPTEEQRLLIREKKKLRNKYLAKLGLYFEGIDRTREMVRKRDCHTCQDCGKKWKKGTRRFDCHHINGLCGKRSNKYDKVSEMHLMITLCHKCHYNRPDHRCKSKEFSALLTKVKSNRVMNNTI